MYIFILPKQTHVMEGPEDSFQAGFRAYGKKINS
jgi:hypothetical protein